MAKYALTRIKHGNPDGSIVEIQEGEEVKGLSKEALEALPADVIGDAPANAEKIANEKAALEARIAELQGQLDEARGGKPGQYTSTPDVIGQASGPQAKK